MGVKNKLSILKFWRHKYFWATVLFIVILGFLDPNSLLQRYRLYQQNQALREEIAFYEEKYQRDTRELQELETNPEAVEKVARVHLFMKTENEDVYILE
ncbi:MAG: septum formation initiator family protein [Bacteroidaceae bacterium]|nr:septum formation initiator family protein [Bacteroidaceae bacterium]MBR2862664.1 septum formation initiator family protein [Bacteroidaceae bacterium]